MIKMGPRDKHQYGGTKTSILENKGTPMERWVPTADLEKNIEMYSY